MISPINMKPIVEDNFLTPADFDPLKKELFGDFFPWYFHPSVATDDDREPSHFFWTHIFFERDKGIASNAYKKLHPIFNKLKPKALIRVKANMYSNQGRTIEHHAHTDYPFKHKGALFSLNTCNGSTHFKDNIKIQSVENRMILFNPSLPHHSSTCTDAPVRVNIVFNYF